MKSPISPDPVAVTPGMICCKPMRQQFGLACEAAWLAGCLASQCAKLQSLEHRRRYAAQVAGVKRLSHPDIQEYFRAEVKRLYEAKRKSA